jgi:hypothetical protein
MAYSEWNGGDNPDTGHHNGGKEESSHASQNSAWNGDERSSKLGEDTHDNEPEAAKVSCLAVGATSEGNDTVVLSKG